MKLRHAWFLGLAGLALSSQMPATAQQAPSAPQQKDGGRAGGKPLVKKVWTDDDLQALRKPWDEYADQKAQTEQAAASTSNPPQKTPPTKKEKPAVRDAYLPPKTVEEAEGRLSAKQREVNYQLESLERVKQEYADEPNEQAREGLKKKLEQMNTDLKEAQAHLKLLEASLEQLKPKSLRQ